ncbi:hypothetical protein JVU11DRAFT_4295 [Chiua virens]|nr:hypothetical protein JVU11DRAFT_4295 [Chiua virens]
MLDTRRIMRFFGLGGSPQSAPGRLQKQRPATQYYPPSNSFPKPPSPSASNNDGSEADYPPLTAPAAPTGASIAPFQASKTSPVLFYDKNDPFYEFTNFSPHDVMYKGKTYPTSEHLFQAFKFLDNHPEIAEQIRTCGERPMLAFDEAHRNQKLVRSDWRQVNIEKMEIALRLKFTQHPDLKALLLGTGDADLIENSPRDYFWGIGADHSGRNELGKTLTRLREELRQEQNDPSHMPNARRDETRLSIQDLTSLVPSQLHAQHSSQGASPLDSGLCEYCHVRPKFQNHPYCGRTCATQATKMCNVLLSLEIPVREASVLFENVRGKGGWSSLISRDSYVCIRSHHISVS